LTHTFFISRNKLFAQLRIFPHFSPESLTKRIKARKFTTTELIRNLAGDRCAQLLTRFVQPAVTDLLSLACHFPRRISRAADHHIDGFYADLRRIRLPQDKILQVLDDVGGKGGDDDAVRLPDAGAGAGVYRRAKWGRITRSALKNARIRPKTLNINLQNKNATNKNAQQTLVCWTLFK
jgi:hypothetical protein